MLIGNKENIIITTLKQHDDIKTAIFYITFIYNINKGFYT